MSDRWGPSVDCPECGHTVSQIELQECPRCEQVMCKHCISNNHDCTLIEAQKRAARTGNHKDLKAYLALRRE